MRRIIQLLKKLFSKGGTLRNGRKVMPNPTKLNRVTEFEKLVAQEGSEFEQSYEKLDKSTKSDYIKKLHTGKLTPKQVIEKIKSEGVKVFAIEQVESAIFLQDFEIEKDQKYALVFGNEVFGVAQKAIEICNGTIEIPQLGTKHSLNIAVSAGIVIWDFFKKMR